MQRIQLKLFSIEWHFDCKHDARLDLMMNIYFLKAEPIMYTCTVSVTKTISSKELDDLILVDSFNSMATR